MENAIRTDDQKKVFVVFADYDKRTNRLLKKLDASWEQADRSWTIEIAGLNGNYSMVRELVRYAGLEVKGAAVELLKGKGRELKLRTMRMSDEDWDRLAEIAAQVVPDWAVVAARGESRVPTMLRMLASEELAVIERKDTKMDTRMDTRKFAGRLVEEAKSIRTSTGCSASAAASAALDLAAAELSMQDYVEMVGQVDMPDLVGKTESELE
jgi:hypothetical protein